MEKKVVYITGGSKGIGKGIAHYLLQKGYNVAISSRNIKTAEKALDAINGNKNSTLAIESDVRDAVAEERAVNAIIKKFGRLDILVANAGLGIFAPIEELKHEEWNQVIATNVTGVFNSVKATLSEIKKSKGYIFTIASLAGTNFFVNGTAYNASKFAIVGFSQALMLDLRQDGVKVTTIMPGSVTSNFNNHLPNEEDDWKIQPEDIGEMIYNLLQLHPRTLPSKIEVRPAKPPVK